MIKVAGVVQHFGIRPVLEDISFEVGTGRTLAIIGPNGTGKTTLLNLLAGLSSPAEGLISIGGEVRRKSVGSELAVRRKTFFLPAVPWFPTSITGRNYLLGVGQTWGVEYRRLFSHVDRLLRVFQLENLGDADLSAYSTGQRKKIGLCSALVTETPYLLLDEPFSGGLDPAGLTALKQILKHLTEREDRTVVISSPVPELVEEVADEVLILDEGRILRHGTVKEIKQLADASTLDEALRALIFPETAQDLIEYLSMEDSA